jgi:hypothetical protein
VSLKKFERPDLPMILFGSAPPPGTQRVRILALDKYKVEVKRLLVSGGVASVSERKQKVSIGRARRVREVVQEFLAIDLPQGDARV